MDILSFDKILYHYPKLEKLKNNIPQFPIHITISLGNFCNHKCLWCTAYAYQQDQVKKIDNGKLLSWLKVAQEHGMKAVGYVGNGEPLAHPGFGQLATTIGQMGIQQGIFTNGYLIDRYLDEIVQNFTYLRVSLDAGSVETHAKMHDVSPSHYPKIMANIEELIKRRTSKNNPTVGVQFATHHENISDIEECARQCAEIGVDYLSIKPVFNRGSVGERIEKNNLTLPDISPVVEKVRQQYQNTNFQIHFRPHQVEAEAANKNTLKYDHCVAGIYNLNLYENGDLVYCGPHRISVGNIDDSIDVIKNNILELKNNLDLSKCPGGCRYHALNRLVHTVFNPKEAEDLHINFV